MIKEKKNCKKCGKYFPKHQLILYGSYHGRMCPQCFIQTLGPDRYLQRITKIANTTMHPSRSRFFEEQRFLNS